MYDPTIGRFFSEDPIGFAGGDANLYRYVGNSPVHNTDPLGTQTYPYGPFDPDVGPMPPQTAENYVLTKVAEKLLSLQASQIAGISGVEKVFDDFYDLADELHFKWLPATDSRDAAYKPGANLLRIKKNAQTKNVLHELVHALDDRHGWTGYVAGSEGEGLAYGFEFLLDVTDRLAQVESFIEEKDEFAYIRIKWDSSWSFASSFTGTVNYRSDYLGWDKSRSLEKTDLERIAQKMGVRLRCPETVKEYNAMLKEKGYGPGCRLKCPDDLPGVYR